MDWLKVVVIDQESVNTDQVIPGEFLTRDDPETLAKGLFAGMGVDIPTKPWCVVSRGNFGSGSSREHAVWALQGAGAQAVVAAGFARIFRRNAVNQGLVPAQVGADASAEIIAWANRESIEVALDLERQVVQVRGVVGAAREYAVQLTGFELHVLQQGGWLELALGAAHGA